MWRTCEGKGDWVGGNRRTLVMKEFGEEEEKTRKERDDWGGTVMEREGWRQRRGNWRVKEKHVTK